ncbi:peroxidase-related enzyme [Paracoccus sp. S-4012]|uniref:peroxidase-related enzyme n=1 Tax=Paracoccus sp. S-4012 TaxID=2665648 RepID=UPI0012B05D0D|nr:peroxidase-related enzyme [Paracoccus sp. S-4012]MRX51527.1 peroxidase-related enzyme [Paracoccus sp. S-4012]
MNDQSPVRPISAFDVPRLEDLPEDIAAVIGKVQEKSGFVPNVFLALARRPDEFRAFFAYHDALMEREGGLNKAEREMIVVATSAANQCQYCVVAHGAILRIRAKDPLIADLVAVNWRKSPLSARQRAMLDFALKVTERAQEITEADRQALRDEGFSDDEIWDIAAIAAFFGMSNRLVNAFDIPPNAEFHALGR